jgi:hypothetical protein
MMHVRRQRSRLYVPLGILVSGLGLSACVLAGGVVGVAQGIALATVVCAVLVYALSGRGGDVGAVLSTERDERQIQLDIRARAVTSVVLFAVCGVVAGREFLQGGQAQPYFELCILALATYLTTLLWLKRRV